MTKDQEKEMEEIDREMRLLRDQAVEYGKSCERLKIEENALKFRGIELMNRMWKIIDLSKSEILPDDRD